RARDLGRPRTGELSLPRSFFARTLTRFLGSRRSRQDCTRRVREDARRGRRHSSGIPRASAGMPRDGTAPAANGGSDPRVDEGGLDMKSPERGKSALPKRGRLRITLRMLAVVSMVWAAIAITPSRKAKGAAGTTFTKTNLVSDLPGMAAVADPDLVNPGGMT